MFKILKSQKFQPREIHMTLVHQLDSLKSNTHLSLDINFRKHNLQQLQKAITDNEDKIFEALYADLRKNKFESYATEIAFIKSELLVKA